jgi:catalase
VDCVHSSDIPVNAPKCPYHSYHRDGAMRTDGNLGRTPTYFPNSQERHIANCTKADPAYGAGVAQAIARLGQKAAADERKSA